MTLSELLGLIERRTWAKACVWALHPAFYDTEALALPPDMHMHGGPFCAFAKSRGGRICFDNKARSKEVAGLGRRVCGVCPFGLLESAFPVFAEGSLAAILYLGGFKSERWRPEIAGIRYDGPAPQEPYPGMKESLLREARLAAGFIAAEIELRGERGNASRKQRPQSFYRDFCMRYIERNYQEDIRISDLAEALKVTPNFLSYRLKTACGKPFTQLLTGRRLEAAEQMLKFESDLGITEIALRCGFRDGNYFSATFRRWKGMSPREYRLAQGVSRRR